MCKELSITYLVNEIGNYSGSRPLVGTEQWYLEITADGPWTITIEPLNNEPSAAGGIEGVGDYVSGYFTPVRVGGVPYTLSHAGEV